MIWIQNLIQQVVRLLPQDTEVLSLPRRSFGEKATSCRPQSHFSRLKVFRE